MTQHTSANAAQVSQTELSHTVTRMEQALSTHPHASVQVAYQDYLALKPRFTHDLGAHPRDLYLAQSAALMMVQAVAQRVDG